MSHTASDSITPPTYILGIDAGGTFTDFALLNNGRLDIHKVLSTPDNPAHAILQGIQELGLQDSLAQGKLAIIHGSTVATNAALERKGARTVYIANAGFKDILTIGRQARDQLYQLNPEPVLPPVPEELCLEIDCRRDANGKLIKALDQPMIAKLRDTVIACKPEAIAINLLFSYLNDAEERAIESALQDLCFTTRSSFVLPKYKEYERGIATWLNACLGPKVADYMNTLSEELKDCPISIMQSAGGTMSLDQASQRAVNLLLSGPAGGLAAIRHLGQLTESKRIISFDMGGTSTDVALMDGDFSLTDEGKINRWPVAIPMLDMHTIGAGGGSVAWLDEAGMLHVGPKSAGSDPGPACYGRGGTEITVTDANLFLGKLQANAFLGGRMQLDVTATTRAITALAKKAHMTPHALAEGVIQLAEQQMVQALHAISVQRGHDPQSFSLCCFGGAGGMHVCALAEQMQIKRAIVPRNSGVLSAFGMLCAPKQRQLVHTHLERWSNSSYDNLRQEFARLEQEARTSMASELESNDTLKVTRSLDMRYQGQSFSLNVAYEPDADQTFIAQHQRQFGHTLDAPVELVNLALEIKAEREQHFPQPVFDDNPTQAKHDVEIYGCAQEVPVYARDSLNLSSEIVGPAIITEHVSTTWVKPGWKVSLDGYGNLLLLHL